MVALAFMTGFVLGCLGRALFAVYTDIDLTEYNARLLRKILSNLDPDDPDGEP